MSVEISLPRCSIALSFSLLAELFARVRVRACGYARSSRETLLIAIERSITELELHRSAAVDVGSIEDLVRSAPNQE